MLLSNQDCKIEYEHLCQYIEGWLHYRENKKYERFWFVLRGNILHGRDLCTAYLYCFKDLNIHVDENLIGSVEIHSHDKVELLKCSGNKPMKCDFTIMLSQTKFHFRADDEISRDRWIYALCDLIGKCQPPSELPTERNEIRASASSSNPAKKGENKSAFHRSKTVELPSTRMAVSRRGSTPLPKTNSYAPNTSLLRSKTTKVVENPPVIPPPRPFFSLPFILDPSARLDQLPWFYPGMKREEAQEKLANCHPGYYLLRDSESKIGSYTLTFKDNDRIKNHMIIQSSDRQYRFHNSEVDTSFPSPQKAVEFYMLKKHSKTITPIPYCENAAGSDKDYVFPPELNVNTESVELSPQSPRACGYTHRALPPTPEDGISYIDMTDGDMAGASTEPRYRTRNICDVEYIDLESKRVPTDERNGYLKVGDPSVGANHTPEDSESYLAMRNPEEDNKTNYCQDQSEYVEYDKQTGMANCDYTIRSTFANGPGGTPPKPPSALKSQNSISFCHYDDVRLAKYENDDVKLEATYQNDDVVSGATMAAPPIPVRGTKPELPPRGSYRT